MAILLRGEALKNVSGSVVRAVERAACAPASVQLLTTKEAAALLRVHPHTLEVWRSTGRYPELCYLRVGNHAVRYRLSDLERFIVGDRDATGRAGNAA